MKQKLAITGYRLWASARPLFILFAFIGLVGCEVTEVGSGQYSGLFENTSHESHRPVSDIEKRKALMHFKSMGNGYLSQPEACMTAADLIRKGVVSPSDQMIWERVLAEYATEGLASSPRKPDDWHSVNSMVEAVMGRAFPDKPEFLRRIFIKAVNRKVNDTMSDTLESRFALAEKALDSGANVAGGVILGFGDVYKNLNNYFGYSCYKLDTYSDETKGMVSRMAAKLESVGGGGLDSFQQGLDLAREEAQLVPLVAAGAFAIVAGAVVTGAPMVVEKGKQFVQEGGRLLSEERSRASSSGAYQCPRCEGYGKISSGDRFGDGYKTCPRCDGTRWLKNGLPFKP